MAKEGKPTEEVASVRAKYWEGFATEFLLRSLPIPAKPSGYPCKLFKKLVALLRNQQYINVTGFRLLCHKAAIYNHMI